MPFIKRDVTPPASDRDEPGDGFASHVAALSSPDAEARWSAARGLGGRTDAVSALTAALAAEEVSRVHEAIMTALMRVRRQSERPGAAAIHPLPGCRETRHGDRGTPGDAGGDPAIHGVLC